MSVSRWLYQRAPVIGDGSLDRDRIKAYAMRKLLLEQALQVVRDCACRQGCPGCVGPVGEIGEDGKATAIALLEALTE